MRTLGPSALSEPQLVAWGERIGASAEPPLWMSLNGPLGAGKSVLARAVCRGAGVTGHIPSPSFTLVQSYRSRRGFTIHHVDLYRLRPGDPIEPLGWDDLMDGSGFVLLEWANRAGGQQPEDRWEVEIDYHDRADRRTVEVRRLGAAPELIEW
ncbi:MAG: tRNA (adenosine(37)-N6)-threonylcarbamoyltransferase complex ATPase subunit type 1 TsaE [Gemmatimonadetes bacterium]|uniref:tRNA threonylcarbamoyladenosine biosynthesis protein TsaE n=1 Tax=Candidatus Kutchimonas denitrificans TaxID=3056748 RepID=A0AAE4Z502_9BACT|nr:tRNA (adenosine(37)-N6)-threonylcarbamoyltransferase complex ATPase subunit type 1 TsaE [Gemmatimonadota bacterium]NIR73899.1 tRNA (adenosine(37)-N6)-threonylcarbamoyltransferase complex ATPase subunit type 1 TsaE [Candidatus Kutchimonas denitrificans]NIR99705.1 tRNA (adenosine(37)-N6)-threonylcarbamoyltransferase complex ATPase subunit type 1 TsaE [Gemmatimonadota bacterium]NIT65290.1 tRNA (adenosine(37)-N6)-threonylcarbamoyltransferase complex ATPase subunit type 1 TsaE [Gemmatimonadota bac